MQGIGELQEGDYMDMSLGKKDREKRMRRVARVVVVVVVVMVSSAVIAAGGTHLGTGTGPGPEGPGERRRAGHSLAGPTERRGGK